MIARHSIGCADCGEILLHCWILRSRTRKWKPMARTDSDSTQISAARGSRSSRKLVLVKSWKPFRSRSFLHTGSWRSLTPPRSTYARPVEDPDFRRQAPGCEGVLLGCPIYPGSDATPRDSGSSPPNSALGSGAELAWCISCRLESTLADGHRWFPGRARRSAIR